VDVISQDRLTEAAAIHPAELLNMSAGVNIHRGSGQEHLTAIRSPVLTGGAGAALRLSKVREARSTGLTHCTA